MVEYLPLCMFVTLLLMIMLGFPVAFTIAGTALTYALIGYAMDAFRLTDLAFIPFRVFGVVQNLTLIAVPLFIFMGIMLEKSGLAAELLEAIQRVFRRIKGGLAIAVVLVGALLAASTGIVGASVVMMGSIALPTMLKWRYDKALACGTIAASGTLGQIIPPSIILVLLGDMMSVDVGDMFVGAIIPGFTLVILYMLYIIVRVWHNPSLAPAVEILPDEVEPPLLPYLFKSLLPPFILVLVVLGSILGGKASPTEASACGAFGALVLTLIKGRFTLSVLRDVSRQTAMMTAMVFTILIGAQFFGVVFKGLSGDALIAAFITEAEIPRTMILVVVMALMFVLGFFLDFIEICFIVIPVVGPLLVGVLGFDPLWLAIMIAINLQTSFLTPPFGFALFYLKGVAPPEISTMDIYRGIVPFVLIQLGLLCLLAIFPEMITWLPDVIFPD